MKPRRQENEFDTTLHRALRALGWFFPETEEEILVTDEPEDDTAALPPELRDPFAVFEPRERLAPTSASSASSDPDITDELSRAARQGKHAITPQIEDVMRRDRDAAEQAKNGTDDD